MLNLAIVDDDIELCEALHDYLSSSSEFSSVLVFHSVEDFIGKAKSGYRPEIVLQDIELPGMSGIEALPVYHSILPETKILMNSVLQNSENVFAAICAGALGYIEKGYPLEKVKESILQVHQGGSPMSPAIARHVINFFNPQKKFEEELSARERDIVQGIVDGLSYKLIASRYNVSIDTVRTHITRIYRKLHINSKGELLAKFMRR